MSRHDKNRKRIRSASEIVAGLFRFYRVCADTKCRRAQKCAGGNKPPCFDLLWPEVAERDKEHVRAMFIALKNGSAIPDAIAAGDAAAARWDAFQAPQAEPELQEVRDEAAPDVPVKREPVGPRIRSL